MRRQTAAPLSLQGTVTYGHEHVRFIVHRCLVKSSGRPLVRLMVRLECDIFRATSLVTRYIHISSGTPARRIIAYFSEYAGNIVISAKVLCTSMFCSMLFLLQQYCACTEVRFMQFAVRLISGVFFAGSRSPYYASFCTFAT